MLFYLMDGFISLRFYVLDSRAQITFFNQLNFTFIFILLAYCIAKIVQYQCPDEAVVSLLVCQN